MASWSSWPSISSVNFKGMRYCSRHWAPASTKKGNKVLVDGVRGLRCAILTSRGSLTWEVEDLDLFLLPSRRLGRRLADAEEDATMVTTLGLFLLPRGRPRPRFSAMTPASRSTNLVLAMEIFWWITGQAHGNPNQSGKEDNAATKINSAKLGFTWWWKGPYL
jgi:hypothetical protein